MELSLKMKKVLIENMNVNIVCETGSNPDSLRMIHKPLYIHRAVCTPCANGKYTLRRGTLQINNKMQPDNSTVVKDIQDTQRKHTCNECTTGGLCSHGTIISRGNFYGFEHANAGKHVRFFPCPTGYCCSSKKDCLSYNTCEQNRTGILCGQCKQNHTESFFSTSCIENKICTSICTAYSRLYCVLG